MDLIKILYKILFVVMILNFFIGRKIIFPESEKKDESIDDPINKKEDINMLDNIIVIIINLCSIIFLIIFSLYLKINLNFGFLFLLIFIYGNIFNLIRIFLNLCNISNVINKNSIGSLSREENDSIFFISAIIPCFDKFWKKMYKFIYLCSNKAISDFMLFTFYIFFISLFIFLILSLLIRPIKSMVNIMKKISNYLISKFKKNYIKIRSLEELEFYNNNIYTIKLLKKIKRNRLKKIMIISLFLSLFLDIIKTSICYIIFPIIYIICLLKMIIINIYNKIYKLNFYFQNLSTKRIVGIFFRISIFLGIIFTIIINRYNSFLYYKEQSTSIFEFISSVILIPIIFEWIYSYKNFNKN